MRFIKEDSERLEIIRKKDVHEFEQDLYWWGLSSAGIEPYITPFMQEIITSLRHAELKKYPLYQIPTSNIDYLTTKPSLFFTGADCFVLKKLLNKFSKRIKIPDDIDLNIYLYEPLSYVMKERENRLHATTKKPVEQGNDGFSDTAPYEKSCLMSPSEIEAIKRWAEEHNIKNNITIWTSDYNISEYKFNYPQFKLKCLDWFLKHMSLNPTQTKPNFNKLEKKFFCANKRYALHRHLVASFLSQKRSIEMSWHYKLINSNLLDPNYHNEMQTFFEFDKVHGDYQDILTAGQDYLKRNTCKIDLTFKRAIAVENCTQYKNFPAKYEDIVPDAHGFNVKLQSCFVAIVNETKYGVPTANFTEKTFQPIRMWRPFILTAPPYTLEYMKKLGFKTFDRWWSEEYDSITNHTERLNAIFDLIEEIDKKPIEELSDMLEEMYDTLAWNYFMYQSFCINPVILE